MLTHIQDYSMFVVPSANVSLVNCKRRPKVISKLLWNRVQRVSGTKIVQDHTEINMNAIMRERYAYQDGNIVSEIPPLKIRLGFTGVNYMANGVSEKKVFAVMYVTFAKNFDALDYIKEVFLKEPTAQESNYSRKMSQYNEMLLIWKRLIRFVAYDNLGLDETLVGKPEDYVDDAGGVLGVDSLLNMFQVDGFIKLYL
jgi:hypothetical protein